MKKRPPKSPGALTLPNAIAAIPAPVLVRERILHACVEVLNEEGFGALTQKRVCERAGIRQSHLTYYFPTRNDLLREAAAYGCTAMLGAVSQGIDQGVVTLDNIHQTLNVDVTDRRWARLMNALIAASDEDSVIKAWLAAFDEKVRAQLFMNFRQLGLDVQQVDIELWHATYVGAVLLDLGESTDASLARAERVISLALDNLLANARARTKKKAVKGKK